MLKNNLSILICHFGIHSNEQHQQHNFEAEAAKTFFTDLMIQKARWIMTSQGWKKDFFGPMNNFNTIISHIVSSMN